jgi:hypothetical protein
MKGKRELQASAETAVCGLSTKPFEPHHKKPTGEKT